jgi:hypothetical protein
MRTSSSLVSIGTALLGFVFCGLGAIYTFTFFRVKPTTPEFFLVFGVTILASLGSLALGYSWMVLFGGFCSMKASRMFSRITKSKQVVEVKPDDPPVKAGILERTYLFFVSILMFLLLTSLAWDLYNADGRSALFLRPIVHALDAFSKPAKVGPFVYSVELLPVLLALLALVGTVPSLALPYLRRFKVTSVNSAPFHITVLTTFTGLIVGLGAGLTLVGLMYRVLWIGKAPFFYRFVILVAMGLSIQFALGTYLGRGKSELLIEERLRRRRKDDWAFVGRVTVEHLDQALPSLGLGRSVRGSPSNCHRSRQRPPSLLTSIPPSSWPELLLCRRTANNEV